MPGEQPLGRERPSVRAGRIEHHLDHLDQASNHRIGFFPCNANDLDSEQCSGPVERPPVMDRRRTPFAAFALLLTVSLGTAVADDQLAAPTIFEDGNGTFHVDFTTPSVFDLSSDLVTHDDAGRFRAAWREVDPASGIDLLHTVSGTCKSSRGVTTVKQRVIIAGQVGGGDAYKAVSNYKGVMVGYGADAELVGINQTRSCLKFDYAPFSTKKVVVCTNSFDDQVFPHDGRWAIRLTFDHVGKHVIGTATVHVGESDPAHQKSYAANVTGKIAPDGEATFKLKPVDDNGVGGAITLRALVIPRSGDTPPVLVEILEVGGKILGQRFAEAY